MDGVADVLLMIETWPMVVCFFSTLQRLKLYKHR